MPNRRVETTMVLTDRYSGPLRQIIAATQAATRATNDLQRNLSGAGINNTVNVLNQQFNAGVIIINNFAQAENEAAEEARGLGAMLVYVNQGLDLASKAWGMLSGAVSTATDTIDEYSQASARIHMMNDGLQTTKDLQDKIFAAAQNARGSYQDMSELVGKLGINAGTAFKNAAEVVNFSELIQKSFAASGASGAGAQGAMIQLQQSLSSGTMMAEEFNSIAEQAPSILRAIVDFTEAGSVGALKKMASEGKITSKVIKDAMFAASDSINAQFSAMPKTFGQSTQMMGDVLMKNLAPAFDRIIQALNSDAAARFMGAIGTGAMIAATAVYHLVGVAEGLYNVIADNWSIVGPMLAMLAGAITAAVIPAISAATAVTYAWAGAMYTAAMAELAVLWPVLLIGAAIAALIYTLVYLQDMWISVFGIIGGIVGGFVGFATTAWVMIQDTFAYASSAIAAAWYGDLGGMYAAVTGFVGYAIEALRPLGAAIDGLFNAFGIDLGTTGILDRASGVVSGVEAKFASKSDTYTSPNLAAPDMLAAMGSGWTSGKATGTAAGTATFDWANSSMSALANAFAIPEGAGQDGPFAGYGLGLSEFDKLGAGKEIGDVGKIKKKVDISDESLKLMRELANTKFIQNYVTLTPTVGVTNNIGTINENADAQGIIKKMVNELQDAVESNAEGVYV